MKKRTSMIAAIAGAGLVLTACGGEATDSASTSAASGESASSETVSETEPVESAEESADGGIDVDQGLLSTTVTLPSVFVQGQSEEELNASAKKDGWDTEITLNSDGSATYTLSRGEYNRLVDELRQQAAEAIQDTIDEEPNIYKSVTFTDDFVTIDATVDRKALESSMSTFAFTAAFIPYFFRVFQGVEEKDNYTIVNYIDESTGEVFDTYDSRDNQ